eukprot:357988-Chlamydomonas_euryale.AAC.1
MGFALTCIGRAPTRRNNPKPAPKRTPHACSCRQRLQLIEFISEATSMSKCMEEYDGRKSCAITCAKRLGQFLGDEHTKDKVGARPAAAG